MKNNLKNKAKFFAQYWDQKILTGIPVDKPFTFRRLNHQNIQKGIMYSFLELKSLSDITDEDAIKVAKIANWSPLHADRVKAGKQIIFGDFGIPEEAVDSSDEDYDSILNYIPVFDYLRSKGYALPYNGLSVEDQIEYGWIKIKTNE
tara:strand:- start:2565 stop:3005 length:441 start_codon:yes stop_codon:yes gene_type:complete